MEEIKKIDEQTINEMKNKHHNFTKDELMLIMSIRKLKNPFRMISAKEVMKDLNISESAVYKTFNRKDFPVIKVGKRHQVMLLPYLMWKMTRKD